MSVSNIASSLTRFWKRITGCPASMTRAAQAAKEREEWRTAQVCTLSFIPFFLYGRRLPEEAVAIAVPQLSRDAGFVPSRL
jgi:hypothetical protein